MRIDDGGARGTLAPMMTSAELRALLMPLSDGELHAAITIAETILAGRRPADEDDTRVCPPFPLHIVP